MPIKAANLLEINARNMYFAELRLRIKQLEEGAVALDLERGMLKLMLWHVKQGRVKQYRKLLTQFRKAVQP